MYRFDVRISSAVRAEDGGDAAASRPETARADRSDIAPRGPLDPGLLGLMQRYWCAANYLTVAQIYLQDNPLLREPLRAEHVKPRLLGHWGTSPGLSLIYVHLNRLIREHDADVILSLIHI